MRRHHHHEGGHRPHALRRAGRAESGQHRRLFGGSWRPAALFDQHRDGNEAVLEVIALTRAEASKNGVSVRTQLAEGLPLIRADRVQLQQVIVNLIINAVEAMSGVGGGARELLISTRAGRLAANGQFPAVP